MRSRTFILVAALLAVLVVGGVGLWIWDSSRSDVIADGVSVNGIELAGLSPEQARTKLERSLLAQLDAPITIQYGRKEKFHLSAKRARVTVNVDAMVDKALEESRSGTVFGRLWRQLTGEEAHANIVPTITYSDRTVDKLVDRISRTINRPVAEASVQPTPTSLGEVNGHSGLKVRARALRASIVEELTSPSSEREVDVDVVRIRPKTSVRDLEGKYPTYLTVSKDERKLRLWKDLRLEKTYDVAVGQPEYPTPEGLFSIQNKQVDPSWSVPNSSWAGDLAGKVIPGGSPDNPLKARWMGIHDGAGIHGTADVDSLGSAASHGCVRMEVEDVKDLYDRVPVGTPIFIG